MLEQRYLARLRASTLQAHSIRYPRQQSLRTERVRCTSEQ